MTINDRGPFVPGRIIDLSRAAADALGFLSAGVTDVKVEVVGDTAVRSASATPTAPTATSSAGDSREVGVEQQEATATAQSRNETESTPKSAAGGDGHISIGQAIDNLDQDFGRVMNIFTGEDDG